jgi:FkbM family methyltransferase
LLNKLSLLLANLQTMKLKNLFKYKSKKITRNYYFGEYFITLSENHVLDKYQERFPLYDRFLPNFCSKLNNLIVDIGANIGDTSVAIYSKNLQSDIIGVEPDKTFFNECISNIKKNNLEGRFYGVNKFISSEKGKFSIKISENNSTGYRVEDEEFEDSKNTNTMTFKELIDEIPNSKKNSFDLLKIDTDGFDWDVLLSFVDYAKKNLFLPRFIYFEMQTFLNNKEFDVMGRDEIIEKYEKSILEISKLEYTNFCLFDNFGTFVKKTNSVKEIFELNNYIKRSQINNLHSTIYYFDVLAYKDIDNDVVDLFLKENYF